MKPIKQAKSVSTQSYPKTLTACFEEYTVVLPEYIIQPTIQKLAIKVQAAMFQEEELKLNSPLVKPPFDQQQMLDQETDSTKTKDILNLLINSPNADASVLIVITNEPKPKLMLTRRAAHLNSHAGEVSFAGGKHDIEDGNNLVTALREACEETALPPNQVQIIGQLPTQVSKTGLVVRPIVVVVEPSVIYVAELGEIERIFWADFESLIDQPTVDYILPYRMGDQTVNIRTPSWNVDGEIVWGLTGRILASLLEIGFERQVAWYYEPTTDNGKPTGSTEMPPSSS